MEKNDEPIDQKKAMQEAELQRLKELILTSGKNNAKIFGYSEPLIGEKKDPFGDNLDQQQKIAETAKKIKILLEENFSKIKEVKMEKM